MPVIPKNLGDGFESQPDPNLLVVPDRKSLGEIRGFFDFSHLSNPPSHFAYQYSQFFRVILNQNIIEKEDDKL
jgi:hypothetical protein